MRITARCKVCQASFARLAPRARRDSNAKTTETPTTNTNVGKTRSVGVRPIQSAWFIKCHEPGPPLLLTMIMKAMVMPRTTSSDRMRLKEVDAGLAIVCCLGCARAGFVTAGLRNGQLQHTLRA